LTGQTLHLRPQGDLNQQWQQKEKVQLLDLVMVGQCDMSLGGLW
jgi:hypothetical protein